MRRFFALAALFLLAFTFAASCARNPAPTNADQGEAAYAWRAGPPLLSPGPLGAPDEVAVKDPSVVFFENAWHVFYTCRSKDRYTLGYVSAPELSGLENATRHYLDRLNVGSDYAVAAPQVFFFTPRKEWVLVYQAVLCDLPGNFCRYTPMYSTSKAVSDPSAWSEPRPLVRKSEPAKWIDFWVICDFEKAYLFYTRSHRQMYYMTTSIGRFPQGFGDPRPCPGAGEFHEAGNVYRIKDTGAFLMLMEMNRAGERYFDYAIADSLSGPWTRGARPFCTGASLDFGKAAPWTSVASHGELIRTGYDEKMEIDSLDKIEFLIQGANKVSTFYVNTPWKIGLIRNF